MTKQVNSSDTTALKAQLDSAVDSWFTALVDEPVTPPPPLLHPETLTLTPGTGSLKADWTLDSSKVVASITSGRDGSDSTGYGAFSTAETTSTLSRTFDKLNNTAYTITVVITYVDGYVATLTKTASPSTGGSAPAAAGVPKVGKSGFIVNTIQFCSNPTSMSQLQADGNSRGMPYDGAMFFPDRGSTWEKLGKDMSGGWDGNNWAGAIAMLKAGMVVVAKMPIAPETEGSMMNQNGANNLYRSQQMAIAANLKAQGANLSTLVIEFGWEPNGDWYQWRVNSTGGKAAYKASVKNAIQNFRDGGLTNVRFGLCLNINSVNSMTWSDGFSAGYHDVVSIDEYDMWNPSFTQGDWDGHQNQALSLKGAALFAAANNVQWGQSEGGNCNPYISGQYGGDNPKYWEFEKATINQYKSTCAYHVTFNQAGDIGHDWGQNPVSFARYKQLWVPGS